jgi:hypothetical protein
MQARVHTHTHTIGYHIAINCLTLFTHVETAEDTSKAFDIALCSGGI